MKTMILKFDDEIKERDLVLSLGFFDGMHIAHQTLLNQALEIAQKLGKKSALMTFSTHVLSFIKQQKFQHLTNLDEKIKKAEALGFDYFYVFQVTQELTSLSPELFITRFLSCADTVVVGFDFTFGSRGKGNVDLLKAAKQFHTIVLDEMSYEHQKIGSSRIRDALSEGDIELANHMLGYRYTISGKVIKGKGRGKYLSFPTANIDFDGYLLPKIGVYATLITVDGIEYDSMTNIGDNPTFSDMKISMEVNILKFKSEIYGKTVHVAFEKYLRPEIKYATAAELIQRMHLDEEETIKTFKKMRS